MNIPTPPRGYWAKLKSRKKVKKMSLPKADRNTPNSHVFREESRKSKEFTEEKEVQKPSMDIGIKIKVPQRLHNPHFLVSNTKKALQNDEPDHYSRVRSGGKNKLDVYIGPDSINRAMRILNALIKGVNKLGYEIKTYEDDRIYVMIDDEKVQFCMREKGRRIKHIKTEKEMNSYWTPEWDYIPTGALRLEIHSFGTALWTDKKTKTLEGQLDDFVKGLIKSAQLQKEWKIQKERQRILDEKRRKLRYQEQTQEELEAKELEKLIEQSENFSKSLKIYEFIDLVKEEAGKSVSNEEDKLKLKGWIIWATQQADRLNLVNQAVDEI